MCFRKPEMPRIPEHSDPSLRKTVSFSSVNSNFASTIHRLKQRQFLKSGLECSNPSEHTRNTLCVYNDSQQYNQRYMRELLQKIESKMLCTLNFFPEHLKT